MTEQTNNEKTPQVVIPPFLQRVVPRTISGTVNPLNNHAIDWGWHGFVAYGAQNSVVVVDPSTVQCIQVLAKHQATVVKVKWRNTKHYHTMSAAYMLVLASADSMGIIHIWNVSRGETISTLQDGNKPVSELTWLGNLDGSEYLLAALHPPYAMILWDTRHGSKVWKKSYTETLTSFSLDPFNLNNMAFLCPNCILFIEDFGTNKSPSSNGKRFFISAPLSPSKSLEERATTLIRNKMKQLVAGDAKNKADDAAQLQDCVQLLYHQSCHDVLILVFAREVLFIDLIIKQTIGIIVPDRNMAPIIQVTSCWQRDALFCLHESGSISSHFRKTDTSRDKCRSSDNISGQIVEFLYEKKCHSEPLRLGRGKEPIAFTMNPVTEMKFAFLLGPSDSRLVFKDLMKTTTCLTETSQMTSMKITDNHFAHVFQSEILKKAKDCPSISITQLVPHSIDQDTPSGNQSNLRIMVAGLLPSVMPATTIRMCPPLTTKNINHYVPVMAKGSQSGEIQIINLATGEVEREFALHTCVVRGIEWTSLNSFLSFGHQQLTNAQGRVRNELIYTHVHTGYNLALRTNKTEESPIEMIRVSYLKQYFIVVLSNDPLELWDCNTLTPLRTVSRKSPRISAMEWSPMSHVKPRRDSLSKDSENCEESTTPGTPPSVTGLPELDDHSRVKETLVFTSVEGQLFHFSVKGNVFTDGTKVPPNLQRSLVTFIAWKNLKIVLSDADGNISIWDLKTRAFRTIATHRGYIKKVRFAPGRDNMKLVVLYRDGVDIWDIKDVTLIAQLKSPKDCLELVDIDWAASDNPVAAFVDGTIKILDVTLKKAHSPISRYFTRDPVSSPYLLSPEASLNLRTLLTHQPWKNEYSLHFTTEDGFAEDQIDMVTEWVSGLPAHIQTYLLKCNSTMHRALVTSYLFGDKGEIDFWTVTTHYLTQNIYKQESHSVIGGTPLPTSFYHLCDNNSFKAEELDRLYIHEGKDLQQSLKDSLGRKLSIIGEKDRVVRMLLDADPSNPHFYTDCLRASLLSATDHSTQAQSTIKLVATNLIAAGNIYEGIELLCMIGKAGDACRYLQSHGFWNDAIWVAKCVLPRDEAFDLVKRWAHNLATAGFKDKAVCAYLSGGLTSSAVEHLVQRHYHQRAALMLQVLRELDLWAETSTDPTTVFLSPTLTDNTYKKYALFLLQLDNKNAGQYFCNILGDSGKELWTQLMSVE